MYLQLVKIPFCRLFLLLLGDGPVFSVTDHTHTDHGRVTAELFPLKWGFPSVPSGMWGHRRDGAVYLQCQSDLTECHLTRF